MYILGLGDVLHDLGKLSVLSAYLQESVTNMVHRIEAMYDVVPEQLPHQGRFMVRAKEVQGELALIAENIRREVSEAQETIQALADEASRPDDNQE